LSPQGSLFATTKYLDAIGARYEILVARKNGRIDIGLPLVRGFIRLQTNPLFCKYLGVLTGPTESQKTSIASSQLYERIEALALRSVAGPSFDYLFHPSFDNWLPFYWLGFAQQTRYTYCISRHDRDSWWQDADSRLRRSVRRGIRDKIVVQQIDCNSHDAAKSCYKLCMSPYWRRGARALIPFIKFSGLINTLAATDNVRIWLAHNDIGEDVAAAVVLRDWRSAYLLMNGTEEKSSSGANALLLRHIIDETLHENRDFDFEGSMIKPIETYYRLFGARRLPYFRIWNPSVVNASKRFAVRLAKIIGRYDRS
jgi:hypothetical protein